MAKNKRRTVSEKSLLYNKNRKVFQGQIDFEDIENGIELRDNLAKIQERDMMTNREVMEAAFKYWVWKETK